MHGCAVAVSGEEAMQPLVYDEALAARTARHLRLAGLEPGEPVRVGASTDVGDVSEHVPTALFFVAAWPEGTEFHTEAAVVASGTPEAYDAMLDGARVIAGVVAELHAEAGAPLSSSR
jgi:metal-dependent amidase/aminoacylase/carboxypeptidase family protein